MNYKKLLNLVAATAMLVGGSNAFSAVITFDPLSGPNGSTYTGHTEAGFDVTATDSWQEAFNVGNSIPSIFNFAGEGDSVTVVSSSAGTFTFDGMDLGTGSNAGGSYAWSVLGLLGGGSVFNQAGVFSGTFSDGFSSILSNSNDLIDELVISFSNFSISSINLDNIIVTDASSSVPAPGALALLLLGLAGLGIGSRRTAV